MSTTKSTTKAAKLFMNNRSQAVRLPKEFQFAAKEVYIRKEGSDAILSPRPGSVEEYLANRVPVGDDFVKIIETMDDPVPQEFHQRLPPDDRPTCA